MNLTEFLIATLIWLAVLGGLVLTTFGVGLSWFYDHDLAWNGYLVVGLSLLAGAAVVLAVKFWRGGSPPDPARE